MSDHNQVDFLSHSMCAFVHHFSRSHKLKKRETNHHAINVLPLGAHQVVFFSYFSLSDLHAYIAFFAFLLLLLKISSIGSRDHLRCRQYQHINIHIRNVLNCLWKTIHSIFSSLISKHLHQKRNHTHNLNSN